MSMLTRRSLLFSAVALPSLAQRSSRRLNVLMIAVDDLNNRLSCYGDPIVQTPNVDRLAARGVRFDHAYCNYALCNPSRTSLLSGKRPDTTRVYNNRTPPRTYLGEDTVFLPEYFKQQGYFTARVGKIAHGLFEDAVKWDISESRAGAAYTKKQPVEEDKGEGPGKLHWVMTSHKDEEEPDGATARRIVQLLEQHQKEPFFIGCGFHKPHLPWVAPKKYFDLYDIKKIQLPNTPADDRDDIPPIALTHTQADDEMTDMQRRQAILAYHAATSFMDAQLGVVLDAMDRFKLWDNTVVLFFGDHGWHLYDHLQLWRKQTVFEPAARAPMILAAPGMKKGAASPRFVEFVDFYPTLAELAGLPAPAGMEGLSFAPLLKDPQRPWKKAAFTVTLHGKTFGRSVRTERYRYTEWDDENHSIEFYDHEKDPNEWTNIAWPKRARDPRTQAPEKEARELLHAGWKAALPETR